MPTFRQREIGEFFRGGFLAGIGVMIRNVIFSVSLAFAGLTLNSTNALAACAVPNQLTNGQTADASQVMANFNSVLGCVNNAPAGSANALQYNAGSGTFGAVAPLTNGQIAIGSTGNPPQAGQLTAGNGITIANGPGSITISSAATPYTTPLLTNFSWGNQPTGTIAADTSTGLVITQPSHSTDNLAVLWSKNSYPTPPFTAIIGLRVTLPQADYYAAGLVFGDSSGKLVTSAWNYNGSNDAIQISHYINYTSFSAQVGLVVPDPQTQFIAIEDDGTNLTFFVGSDLNALIQVYKESRTAFLSNPSKIGIYVNATDKNSTGLSISAAFFHKSSF